MKNKNENPTSSIDIIPVILSGGSGTRLWPLSRASYPKQYLNLDEKNQFSLLQNTYLRLKDLKNLKNPIIISNQDQRFIVAEQMREINVTPNTILLEPVGRNTAPAITLAALKTKKENYDPFLLILSSDHLIENEKNFKAVIEEGLIHANNGKLVTFGIVPDSPQTGFGYIESEEEISENNPSSKIKKFIEKPNSDLAEEFIKDSHFLWNSGIFLFKSSSILSELEKFEPKMVKVCDASLKKGYVDLDFFRINEEIFKKCSNTPIDISVMEKTSLGYVLKLEAGWKDIGSWEAIFQNSKKDLNGNTLKGKIIIDETKDCYLRSEEKLIVGINLNNLIVIDTNDAILISNKESTQKVKQVVQNLTKSNFTEGKENKKSFRPWGSFTSIEKGTTWQVKKLEINPKASLSLQMHQHRSEHWVVVSGLAKVEIDQKIFLLRKNQSTYIPLGAKHRLSNSGEKPLIIIEIQSGAYLGEDDITRFDDNYGRVKN